MNQSFFPLYKKHTKSSSVIFLILMIRVSEYFKDITKLFHHDKSKSFQFSIPYKSGYVTTFFEKPDETEIRAEILSTYLFNKGNFIMKAYSDDPMNFCFISPNLFPPFKTATSLNMSDKYPISMKCSYQKSEIGNLRFTFKQNAEVSFCCKPFSSFEVHTSTQMFNPLVSLRVEVFHGPNVVRLEAFWKKLCIVGTNLEYNWKQQRLMNVQLVSGLSLYGADFGCSASFIGRAIKLLAKYKINERTKIGALVGVKNIGFEADKIISLAGAHKLDQNTKFKVCLNSNKTAKASLKVKYQDFLLMSFYGALSHSSDSNNSNSIKSNFGANIIFDLTKREKLKIKKRKTSK